MNSRRNKVKTKSSRGKSKKRKRIIEGRKHKTKVARLQCKECGAWFESLGQINQHYSAVGHKRTRKPPKRIKFSKEYSQQDLDVVEAMIELLKNPMKIREMIREHLKKRRFERYERGY